MTYQTEFDVYEFPWWSGACDTIRDIENAGLMDELQEHLETVFSEDEGNHPTDTDINDYLWHDREQVYSALGLDKNGKPIDADEDNEEDE